MDVPVQPAPGGPLSDHYDPAKRTVNLSQGVYDGHSIASVAIAAHEVGHAIQHQKAYAPFKLRSALFPAVQFASRTWIFLLLAGFIFQITGSLWLPSSSSPSSFSSSSSRCRSSSTRRVARNSS